MGCHLCDVYCKVAHSFSKDILKAFKREPQRPVSRVKIEVDGPLSFSVRCQHCEEAPCVYACLTGALQKDKETGVVTINQDKCIGCWTCMLVCPFGVLSQDNANKKSVKCDLCQDEEIPVCVANCPNDALVYEELPEEAPVLN